VLDRALGLGKLGGDLQSEEIPDAIWSGKSRLLNEKGKNLNSKPGNSTGLADESGRKKGVGGAWGREGLLLLGDQLNS